MGLFTDADAPIVWRGPMATKAMDKMLMGTQWGRLDVLVVDMPPGGAWFGGAGGGRGAARWPLPGRGVWGTRRAKLFDPAGSVLARGCLVRKPSRGLKAFSQDAVCPQLGRSGVRQLATGPKL